MSANEQKTQEAVNADWNAMAGEWDDVASAYRDIFINILWEQTGLEKCDTEDDGNQKAPRIIVDFGCGTGLLTEKLRQQSPGTSFVCLDAASAMIGVLQGKIKSGEWKNVDVYCTVLARYVEDPNSVDAALREKLDSLQGTVDLVVASSVLSFVPEADLSKTMAVLGKLLKPGGLLCHSDWPPSDDHPNGFDEVKAKTIYDMASLETESTKLITIKMEDTEGQVFVGVAKKAAVP